MTPHPRPTPLLQLLRPLPKRPRLLHTRKSTRPRKRKRPLRQLLLRHPLQPLRPPLKQLRLLQKLPLPLQKQLRLTLQPQLLPHLLQMPPLPRRPSAATRALTATRVTLPG